MKGIVKKEPVSFFRRKGAFFLFVTICGLCFMGCVRLTGGAGYWTTSPDREAKAKQASFDTDNLVPKEKDKPSGIVLA